MFTLKGTNILHYSIKHEINLKSSGRGGGGGGGFYSADGWESVDIDKQNSAPGPRSTSLVL